MLLNWRNNSATREASHNTALINEDEHILWLKRILASENRKLYVAEIDGVPVGTVRVDSEALGYELSWTVSTTMRSSGIGKVKGNRKEQFAIDIYNPHRLIFKPEGDPHLLPDGGIDIKQVTLDVQVFFKCPNFNRLKFNKNHHFRVSKN